MNQRARRLALAAASGAILAVGSFQTIAITSSSAAVATSVSSPDSPFEKGRKAGYRVGHSEAAQWAREERCKVVEIDPAPDEHMPDNWQGVPYWDGYFHGYLAGFSNGFFSVCPNWKPSE
jgi:hypothetical protein